LLWIAFAIAFIVLLLFIKNKSAFDNSIQSAQGKPEINQGLIYNNVSLGSLVNRDTDGDGIPDWEESLWGTDPTKKETTPGIPDSVAIEKIKAQQTIASNAQTNSPNQDTGTLTQTDQLSRDLFASIAAASQNGPLDQATTDQISNSLADHIQNSPPRKVFLLSDIKITANDNAQSVKIYHDTLNGIITKYTVSYTVLDVLQKFIVDANNVDSSVLVQLDPIIAGTGKMIDRMVGMSVPQSLAPLHLDVINALQRLVENISDIKLYSTDVVVALSAISEYDQNTATLNSAIQKLSDAINQKLNN
jgi:hypothetical protein